MSTTKQWVLAGRRVWVDETRVFLRKGFIYEFFVVLTPFFHVSYRRHRAMCNLWIGQQRSTCSTALPSKDSGQSNTTGTINSVYFQSLSDPLQNLDHSQHQISTWKEKKEKPISVSPFL